MLSSKFIHRIRQVPSFARYSRIQFSPSINTVPKIQSRFLTTRPSAPNGGKDMKQKQYVGFGLLAALTVIAGYTWTQPQKKVEAFTLVRKKNVNDNLPIIDQPLVYAPNVPKPIERNYPAKIKVELETSVTPLVIQGTHEYPCWTFNGHVPGPFIRGRVGDVLEVTLKNSGTPTHNIDFQSVSGPGGGGEILTVDEGETKTATFKLLHPGLFIYQSDAEPAGVHVSNGLYGMILVEPKEGFEKVDKEFFILQSEFYFDVPEPVDYHLLLKEHQNLDQRELELITEQQRQKNAQIETPTNRTPLTPSQKQQLNKEKVDLASVTPVTKHQTDEKKETIVEKIKDMTGNVVDKLRDYHKSPEEVLEEKYQAKEHSKEKDEPLSEKLKDAKDNVVEKISEKKDQLMEKKDNLVDNMKNQSGTLKKDTKEKADDIIEDLREGGSHLMDNIKGLKDSVVDRFTGHQTLPQKEAPQKGTPVKEVPSYRPNEDQKILEDVNEVKKSVNPSITTPTPTEDSPYQDQPGEANYRNKSKLASGPVQNTSAIDLKNKLQENQNEIYNRDKSMKAKVEEAAKEVKGKSSSPKEGIEEKFKENAHEISDKLKNAKNKTEETATNVKGKIEETAKNVKDRAEKAATNVKDKVEETTKNVRDKAEDATKNVKGKVEEAATTVRDKAEKTATNVKDKVEETTKNIKGKVEEVASNVKSKAEEVKDKVYSSKEDLQEKLEEGANEINTKIKNTKNRVEESVKDVKDKLSDSAEDIQGKVKGTISSAKEKVKDVEENVKNRAQDLKEKITGPETKDTILRSSTLPNESKGVDRASALDVKTRSQYRDLSGQRSGTILAINYDDGLSENPRAVVFNGNDQALTREGALQIEQGDRVRLYVGNAGPNLISSFHISGMVFDKVYREGDVISAPGRGIQTTLIPSGGVSIIEFDAVVPGDYKIVDRSLFRTEKGAIGHIQVSGEEKPEIYSIKQKEKEKV